VGVASPEERARRLEEIRANGEAFVLEPPSPRPKPIQCSFCGRSQEQVAKIIAGPKVCICNECVELCVEMLDTFREDGDEPGA
jgi:hypothetical protein